MKVWRQHAEGSLRGLRICSLIGLTLLMAACSASPAPREGSSGLMASPARSDGPAARPLALSMRSASASVAAIPVSTPVSSAAVSAPATTAPEEEVAALTGRGGATRLAELTQIRCDAALTQASEAVHRYRSLSVEEISARSWAEEALRATDLAQRACDMAPDQATTALSLRATALYLHGQYSRAALYLEQVPEKSLPAPLPRAGDLSTAAVVRECQTHRPDLDDLRLGILLKQAGYAAQGGDHLKRAARSACIPLAKLADALRRT